MSTTVEGLRHRIDLSAGTVAVAVGDVLCIGAFVFAGELQHGIDPVANPARYLGTLTPFLLGWLVTSFLGGLYTVDAWHGPKRAVAWTAPAWVGAVVVAQLLRATPVFPGDAALTFALVSIVVGLLLLLPYRAVVATVTD